MEYSSSSESDSPLFSAPEKKTRRRTKKPQDQRRRRREEEEVECYENEELEAVWQQRRRGGAVMLEGYVEGTDGSSPGSDGGEGEVGRTKSLTDEDLEELKGCLDLGFGFNYEEIPELCGTLPALELCYSLSQRFLDEQQQRPQADGVEGEPCSPATAAAAATSTPIANWKISSPGDDPEEVKARLKYWAQAVACTVRLCNQ